MASSLPRMCSTPELHRPSTHTHKAEDGDRTRYARLSAASSLRLEDRCPPAHIHTKRKTGIEPAALASPPLPRSAWKTDAPQHTYTQSGRRGSNPLPSPLRRFLAPLGRPMPPSTHTHKAEDGDRTRYPQLGRLMLYQMSYFRTTHTQA